MCFESFSSKLIPVTRKRLIHHYSIPSFTAEKTDSKPFFISNLLLPRDIKILGWCPGGSVLAHGGKLPL